MKDFRMRFLTVLSLTMFIATPAYADLSVSFNEGAPKDRFSFKNVGECPISSATLKLDLSGSSSGLIFDVTGSGAGVEVFQPLEFVSGRNSLMKVPTIQDGDDFVEMNIKKLAPGGSIAFTVDIDDTKGGREITVSGSEIKGASVRLVQAGIEATASLGTNGKATVKTQGC